MVLVNIFSKPSNSIKFRRFSGTVFRECHILNFPSESIMSAATNCLTLPASIRQGDRVVYYNI